MSNDKTYIEGSYDGGTNYKPIASDVSGALPQGYHRTTWHTTVSNAAVATDVTITSAPGAGQSLVITSIIYESNTAGVATVKEGATTRLNMRHWTRNSQFLQFEQPLLYDTNTALIINTNMTTSVAFAQGYTVTR